MTISIWKTDLLITNGISFIKSIWKIKFSCGFHCKLLFPNIKLVLLRGGLLLSQVIKTIGQRDSCEGILNSESLEWEQLFWKNSKIFWYGYLMSRAKLQFIFRSLINDLIISLIYNSAHPRWPLMRASCSFPARGDFIPLGQFSVQWEQNCDSN